VVVAWYVALAESSTPPEPLELQISAGLLEATDSLSVSPTKSAASLGVSRTEASGRAGPASASAPASAESSPASALRPASAPTIGFSG